MSSLLRAASVAIVDRSSTGNPDSVPRVFGARVLRADNVGMRRPVSLSVPSIRSLEGADDLLLEEEAALPPPPPPDFAEIEEAARLQGYNVGFEQGYAAGMGSAEEVIADSLQRLQSLVSSVHENHTAFFRSAERQVVDLALQIAQKVIEREVENMPDLAVNVIRAALEEMDARTAVRVRVNPDDEELLRRRWLQVVPPGVGPDRVELQVDERVKAGGAVIETTHGEVDAQLDSKLAQLGNALWTFVMDANSAREQQGQLDA